LTLAHWAVRQARFRRHFRVVSKGHRSDRLKRLPEYLSLDERERAAVQPYIDVRDANGRHAVALVSHEMTVMVERSTARWNSLRRDTRAVEAPRAQDPVPVPPAQPAPASTADVQRALAENLLRLSGYGTDDSFFRRSLRDFVSRGRGDNGDA
jgi:hypothetical protein